MDNQDKFMEVKTRLEGIMDRIERTKKLKKELVDLGIAKDTVASNTIHIKPEKFKDYLIYLEEHSDAKI